jgi:hypothetical protein
VGSARRRRLLLALGAAGVLLAAAVVAAVVLWPEDRPAQTPASTTPAQATAGPEDVAGSDISGDYRDRQAELVDCENVADGCRTRSRTLALAVLCRAEECFLSLFPGSGWPPATVTRDGRRLTAEGTVPEAWAHTCQGNPVPTSWSVQLRIGEVVPHEDGWRAGELTGTYEERSGAGDCAGVFLRFDVVAETVG